ncbi:DUF4845 domain-containing protein [Solimonas marina]|uniref:DUF4845 domain-containing protein n=1 Tax=Solimonas marina TaxID=2714601 RepID=A0A969W933_9GAMM|nr:DUF4845 domain-containing protein [Solimonas marina]NKF21799.1 DUF4845 domain-containing protein [Solimonas marina]
MYSMRRQKGLGWFGMLCLLAVIGFIAIVAVKTMPLYLNQMKIASAVHKTAADPENGRADVISLRRELQKYWDIDSIDTLSPRDVSIVRDERGRSLSYDYEARAHLFYNIYVVIEFSDDVPLTGSASS